MSLTSYRAAPPRATRFLPKAKYRDDCLVVNAFPGPVFAGGKTPLYFCGLAPRFRKHKGRLERPFGFGRAECVSRRSLSVFVLRQNLAVFCFRKNLFTLPLADLAATYSPAS
jgi:hypothetical protein